MLNNDPDWDPKLFAGKTRLYYGRWTYKYESAARQGAAGAIIIHTTPSAGYPVAGGADLLERRAVRAAGRAASRASRSQAWATEDAARQLCKARPARISTSCVEAAKSARLQAGAARRHHLARVRQQDLAACRPPTSLGLLPGSDPKLARRGGDLHRAPRSPRHRRAGQDRRHDLQRRRGQRRRRARRCWPSRKRLHGAARSAPRRSILIAVRGGRGAGPARLAVPTRAHPTVRRRARSPRTSTSTAATSSGRTRDLDLHRPRQVVARRRRRGAGGAAGPHGHAATSSRTAASSTAPTSSTSPRSACRRSTSTHGTDFIGKPAGWGKQQVEDYEEHRYHQPSDEFDPNVELRRHDRGRAARLLRRPRRSPTRRRLPAWNPGDEFEAARKKALGEVAKGK